MIDSMSKPNAEMPEWFFVFALVVMFFVGVLFGVGISVTNSKKYYVEGKQQGRGITVFNNSGYAINIASNPIGIGELKNIGSPKELINKTK